MLISSLIQSSLLVSIGSTLVLTSAPDKPSPANLIKEHEQNCNQQTLFVTTGNNFINVTIPSALGELADHDNECLREPSAWRWRYIDEIRPKTGFLVHEKSIDSKLSNVIYTVESAKIFYNDPFKFDSGDPKQDAENERLIAGPQVDDELCGQHLESMLDLIEDLSLRLEAMRSHGQEITELDERHIRLAKVLDSFGHYEAGFLNGKSFSIGAYAQCRNAQLLLPPLPFNGTSSAGSHIDMRFCWARMRANNHLDESLRTRKPNVELQDPLVSTAICVPVSCHTKSFKHHQHLFERLVRTQFKLPRSMYLDEHLELESIFCTLDENSRIGLPLSGKLFCLLMLAWFSAAAYSTALQRGASQRRSLAGCLDLVSCWSDFIESSKKVSSTVRRVDLNTLNLCKVLACAYVVYGHTSMLHFFFASDQLNAMWQIPNDPFLTAILVGTLAVDTFFVITGLLMTMLIIDKLHKLDKANRLPKIGSGLMKNFLYFMPMFAGLFSLRYLKMVPIYFLITWFTRSIFPYLGSGPLWDHGFNRLTSVGACQHQESWFTPVTLGASYLPLFRQCLTPTWSISIDLLLCLVIIPLILLAYRAPRLASIVSVLLGCVTLNKTVEKFLEMDPALAWELKENTTHGIGQLFNKYTNIYTLPHYRLPSMLLGCAAGYALFKYNQGELKQWPYWFSTTLTRVSLAFELILFIGLANIHQARDFLPRPVFRQVFPYVIYLRALWCAANSVIFVRMASDWHQNPLFSLGKSFLMKILSKLNYAILLVHWNLVIFDAQYRETGYYLNKWIFIKTSGAIYVFTIVLATLVHVTLETPLDRILRQYALKETLAIPENKQQQELTNQEVEQVSPVELSLENVAAEMKKIQ